MKKFLTIALVALLAITSVFAGGEKESTGKDGKIEVRVWTSNRHDAEFWTEKVNEYNATNPDNIHVSYEVYADNFVQAVDMAYQTGEAPDIMRQQKLFDKYIIQGKYVDLMPYLTEEEKELTKCVWYDGINLRDGKLYYIPTGNSCKRMFYNKTIFDRLGLEAPSSLEEMVEAATTISRELSNEGIYGFACNLKGATSGIMRSLEPQVQLGTGIYCGYDWGKGVYDFTPYIPYLQAWKEMIKTGFPGTESLDIDPLRSQFAAGKIGMYMSYSQAEPGVYANQFPMQNGAEWGCVQMPTIGGEPHGYEQFEGSPAYLINAESKNVEAAIKAYKALFLNIDNLTEHFEAGLGISNFKEVLDNADMPQLYIDAPALLKTDRDVMYQKAPHEAYPQDFIIEGMDFCNTFAAIIYDQLDLEKGIADLTARYNRVNEKLIKKGVYERITDPNFAR